ncbi:MAG: glutamate-5-semialdehyde dehydrogenase [Clostridia bacterium]|nr:glutamate-5-semialdehyde dehydrogenase [Clostridia bacterium]
MTTAEILKCAVKAKANIACANTDIKNLALKKASQFLIRDTDKILKANKLDTQNARGTVSDVMLDRLTLTSERIKAMADAVLDVIKLPDPVGNVLENIKRQSGLDITKVSVPIGVIAIIFESRPNVTSDAAALSLKSGNVCVLRGGKEAINSNIAIAQSFRDALKETGLDENAVSLVTDTTRNSSLELMTAVGSVDLLIPRGGAGLIRACVENAKVPCIETGTGICHIYVDGKADIKKALDIVENAKTSRPSVCNAAEVCLVDKSIANEFLPKLYDRLVTEKLKDNKIPVELRLDKFASKIISGNIASSSDFDTEFLDYILAIKVVDGIKEAVAHISEHSTGHSEAIITEDEKNADIFTSLIDSSAVYVNASTRFTDGGEFGLGCEIGISTQKIHARGPMGLKEMTSYKYIVRGNGQIR